MTCQHFWKVPTNPINGSYPSICLKCGVEKEFNGLCEKDSKRWTSDAIAPDSFDNKATRDITGSYLKLKP